MDIIMEKVIFIIYIFSIKLKRTRLRVLKLFHKKNPVGEYITPKDTVDSIVEHPVLMEEKVLIYPRSKENDIMAIQTLDRFVSGFSKATGECYAEGLNAIIRNHNMGITVHRQIYTEEDIRKDSTKKNASLYYFPGAKKSKFIIICPGGAYVNCEGLSEGYPLAVKMNELGYTAFVLTYRVREEAAGLAPQADLAAAVRYILAHAEEFRIDPEAYAIMGFSAGGHLVGSFGLDSVGYKNYQVPRPGTIIISYGLISTEKFTHCNKLLLGPEPEERAVASISIDKNITPDYPPVFFWAGKNDILLDYRIHDNELEKALKDKKVPYEYHLYEKAQHGVSMGLGTSAEGWVEKAVAFWESQTI